MKLQIQYVEVLTFNDIESAFIAAAKGRSDAVLWLVSGSVYSVDRKRVAELAVKSRLPVIFNRIEPIVEAVVS